jgi:hypothetical protein
VAAHRWDGELLAAQGRTLKAVAAGLPLKSVLDGLVSAVVDLAEHVTPTRQCGCRRRWTG